MSEAEIETSGYAWNDALTAILLKAASSLTSNVVMQRGRPAKVTKFAREAY